MNYKVYLIKDRAGIIWYCGLTRSSLRVRFNDHVCRRKFDRTKYVIELVTDNLTLLEAVELEKLLIAQYSLLEKGWNKSPGSINGSSNFHSSEQKTIWSYDRRGSKVSAEHATKNRIARLGKTNSDFHKQMISEKKSKPIMCLETGKIYPSARVAAKELNLSYSKISLVCNGKRTTTGGLHFRFITKQ